MAVEGVAVMVPLGEVCADPKMNFSRVGAGGAQDVDTLARQLCRGAFSPLWVLEVDGGYDLVAGFRRLAAAQLANHWALCETVEDQQIADSLGIAHAPPFEHVPVQVVDAPTRADRIALNGRENEGRAELCLRSRGALLHEYKLETGCTLKEIAAEFGISVPTACDALNVHQYVTPLFGELIDGWIFEKKLDKRRANALCRQAIRLASTEERKAHFLAFAEGRKRIGVKRGKYRRQRSTRQTAAEERKFLAVAEDLPPGNVRQAVLATFRFLTGDGGDPKTLLIELSEES